MHEDDWGHFVDLEMNQKETEKKTEKKEFQPKKTQEVKISKNFTVIYEEDIWYNRDETYDSDYNEEPIKEEPRKEEPIKENPRKEEPIKEEPIKENSRKEELRKEKTAEYINKVATLLYCVICASFISCSLLLI